ncbi:unnamed protein product [Arctogadus glacialis]
MYKTLSNTISSLINNNRSKQVSTFRNQEAYSPPCPHGCPRGVNPVHVSFTGAFPGPTGVYVSTALARRLTEGHTHEMRKPERNQDRTRRLSVCLTSFPLGPASGRDARRNGAPSEKEKWG